MGNAIAKLSIYILIFIIIILFFFSDQKIPKHQERFYIKGYFSSDIPTIGARDREVFYMYLRTVTFVKIEAKQKMGNIFSTELAKRQFPTA